MEDENIIMMCRFCHIQQHYTGWDAFLMKFPVAAKVLEKKGWHIQEIFGIRKLVRK